jgi:RNA polymerase sigma factor (sigma-70 family)
MTLGQWLPAFVADKDAAGAAPFDRHRAVLARYFRRRAPPGEAEDLIQEVFVRLLARRASEPIVDPERYIFRAAAAVLADHHRRTALRKVQSDAAAVTLGTESFSPERMMIGAESLDRTLAALQALPPRTRQAFVLHRFENLTYRDIGLRMGVSRSAVEKLIMRALSRLMDALEAAE